MARHKYAAIRCRLTIPADIVLRHGEEKFLAGLTSILKSLENRSPIPGLGKQRFYVQLLSPAKKDEPFTLSVYLYGEDKKERVDLMVCAKKLRDELPKHFTIQTGDAKMSDHVEPDKVDFKATLNVTRTWRAVKHSSLTCDANFDKPAETQAS